MSEEKITISMDEINNATPVPGAVVPPNFASGYSQLESEREIQPKHTGLFIGSGIAVVAFLCIALVGIVSFLGSPDGTDGGIVPHISKERTVSDYRAETIRDIKMELARSDSKLKKRIENEHVPSVNVVSTEVIRCDITTFDGSDKAGKNDSNIDKVSLLIRFNWSGMVLDGYTDLRIVYDVQNKRPVESKIEYTTDPIPLGSDFDAWYDIGAAIGLLLTL